MCCSNTLHHSDPVVLPDSGRPTLFAVSTGGPSQPGRGLPAAVQHALPHAVVVRAGAASAQRGRGLASSTDR